MATSQRRRHWRDVGPRGPGHWVRADLRNHVPIQNEPRGSWPRVRHKSTIVGHARDQQTATMRSKRAFAGAMSLMASTGRAYCCIRLGPAGTGVEPPNPAPLGTNPAEVGPT